MPEDMKCEVVISGMSGRFPEAENVEELYEKLTNKVDLVTENDKRWKPGLFGVPKRFGCMKDIKKFDNKFFDINDKEAHKVDPQIRVLLEVTYETIVDAGYDPCEFRGRKVGVFIGNCFSDYQTISIATVDLEKIDSKAYIENTRNLLASRISHAFDFKGPSFVVDAACSSSGMALYEAFQAIRNGNCEAALVGGANVMLTPELSILFQRLNMISEDGKSKVFDVSADGYARSETVAMIFLQKSDSARRNYASIVHMKTNTDGFKIDGLTYPSCEMQKRLMSEVLKECNLNPRDIHYMEAHATGTPAGDKTEMSSIADVYCSGREEPLLVGSIKSNMGHTEPAAAVCQIVKLILSMERGISPPNLHFSEPHPENNDFVEGRVKVVTEPTPWRGPYIAFNSFGFGGANVHGILKTNLVTADPEDRKKNMIPQLLLYPGRTKESVQYMFNSTVVQEASREFFTLLHKSSYTSPKIKPYRGYKVLGVKDDVQDIKLIDQKERQLWYVFSGMDTECLEVEKDFMQIESFARSIQKSTKILKPLALDLAELVTSGFKGDISKTKKPSIVSAIVFNAAVQVAIVDVLNTLSLKPNGIIGHRLGELVCAYADGCLTVEQVLLASYWLAKAMEESEVYGSVIMQAKEKRKDIQDTVNTGSEIIQKVSSADIWKYDFLDVEKLHILLYTVVPDPKPRNSKWISSSYPEDKWNDREAKFASAEYFIHNLVSPVLFDNFHNVPEGAIVIEIGLNDLLAGPLKNKIGPTASYTSLMKGNKNNLIILLSAIGKFYISGFDPKIEKLYPPVAFPVPRNTPVISSLIKWDHSLTLNVYKWDHHAILPVRVCVVEPGPVLSRDRYLLDHCIDGRFLFPAAAHLMLVHKLILKLESLTRNNEIHVEFHKVQFMRATLLSQTTETVFIVHISKTGGAFEIVENGVAVCRGFLKCSTETRKNNTTSDLNIEKDSLTLNVKDIYKEFRLRGYEYGQTFQGVMAANLSGNEGILKWNDNWVTFLDTLFQFPLLAINKRALLLPIGIEKLTIDRSKHAEIAEKALKEYEGIPVKFDAETREYFSGGVYAKNMIVGFQKRRPDRQFPLLEVCKFVPYELSCKLEAQKTLHKEHEEYVTVCSSIANRILEISGKNKDNFKDDKDTIKISDDLMNKYLNSEENCYVLFNCLTKIQNTINDDQTEQIVKECISNYLNDLENDILSQILLHESSLRAAVEVALENLLLRKLKVVEISEGSQTIFLKIHEIMPYFAFLKISYSVLHRNVELLSKDHLPPNAEVIAWDNKPLLEFKDLDVFILSYLKCSLADFKEVLRNAAECLKDEGFILLLVRTRLVPAEVVLSSLGETSIPVIEESSLELFFQEIHLNIICKMSDPFTSTLYLLRKTTTTSYKDSIVHVVDGEYDHWVDNIREKIIQLQDSTCPERIWLVSEGSRISGIIGLVNCLRQEPGGSNIRCVFTGRETSKIPQFSLTDPFYKSQVEKSLAMNVFQDGSWGSYRIFQCKEDSITAKSEHAYLNILTIGDLSSFAWIHSSMKNITLKDNDVFCHVYYSSLNFKDVMLASGRLPLLAISGAEKFKDTLLGYEFSGRTADGRRVMGIVANKGMATTVIANRYFLLDVPDEWSLEEAATVPIVYITAYYSLITRGRLQKGERVLIHSGSGGVGQAAIRIALSLGCDIYTTVGSEEKRDFLKNEFPELREEQIYNSRETTFEQQILRATKGEGVDVVLNSLAGDKLFASLNCLADNGRFLEIGMYDLLMDSKLGMAIFLKNISFHGIYLDVDALNSKVNDETYPDSCQLLEKGIVDGIVKPLKRTVFNHDQAEDAFRYMTSGKHIGKIVLKMRDEEEQKKAIPSPISVTAMFRTLLDPQKSYIIIGGLGGMGLELCQWLIDRGAKNVILTSRSGVTTGYQKLCLQRWEQHDANVVISNLNAIQLDEARNLLFLAAKLGPVGGIFNLALVLKDAYMEKQTVQNYIDVCECKVDSTKNLDALSRELCPDLEYFVCFSSFTCGLGNAGQSNYGYANSVMERICEDRLSEGLPGLAIRWGVVGDVGFVAETKGSDVIIGGSVPQKINSCLTALEKFLHLRHPVVSSAVLYNPDAFSKKLQKGDLLAYMAKIFGIKDVSSINPETTLGELGMDSLMAEELKQILELNFDTVLSISELQNLKVKDLKKITGHENAETNAITLSEDIGMYIGKFDASNRKDLIPSDEIIHMNTITDGLPLFLIHSVEGNVTSLQPLAETFSCPVYGIQSTPEGPRDSLENLASWYWTQLKLCNNSTKALNLAGYSFGATVAFEMALQAEEDPESYPEIKNLILLDGSHNIVPTMFATTFGESMKNAVDQIVLLRAFSMKFSDDIVLDEKELFRLKSFPERILYAAEKIAATSPDFSSNDIQTAFDLFNSKLRMSFEYKPKYKLKKDVYLIKASKQLGIAKAFTELYDLDQVCEGKIISNPVEGNHYSFIRDNSTIEVSNLMKKIIDEELIA